MDKLQSQKRSRKLHYYFLFNFLLSLFLAMPYFGNLEINSDNLFHIALSFGSNFLGLYMLMALILYPFYRFIPSNRFVQGIAVFLMIVLNLFIFLDVNTYELYRYHINGLVLNLLMTEAAGDSVEVGNSTIFSFGLWIFGIILCQYLFFKAYAYLNKKYKLDQFKIRRVFYIALLLVLADKGTYAYCDLYNKSDYLRYTKISPLYQKLTIKRMMRDKFDFNLDREEGVKFSTRNSLLNYPDVKKWDIKQKADAPNIVIILVESMRFDMLDPEISPYMNSFANESWNYKEHYSGGNASRFGIFSLLYGIHSTYWHSFLSERRSSILIDYLDEADYEFKIISSTKLTYPEFRKTAFVNIPETILDTLPGDTPWQRDLEHQPEFFKWYDNEHDKDKAFFSFLYLDAPHVGYRSPEEFHKFQPAAKSVNHLKLKDVEDNTPYLNKYKNAVYCTDNTIKKLMDEFESRGLMENTVFVITGDHGEEFNETGYWGHTSSFSKYQTKVPFIVKIPGETPKEIYETSSHIDAVPTLLSLAGCERPVTDYANGQDLRNPTPRNFLVSAGWDDCAILFENESLVFNTESYNASQIDVRDNNYKLIEGEERKKRIRSHQKSLLEALNQMKQFSK